MAENGNGNGNGDSKRQLINLSNPIALDLKTLLLLVPLIGFGYSIKEGQAAQARTFDAFKTDQRSQMNEMKIDAEEVAKDMRRRLDLQQFEINAIKLSLAEQGFRFKKGE